MTTPDIITLVVQGGAVGLLGLVLWKVVLPLVSAVQDLEKQVAIQNELLRGMSIDIFNARCRYGSPSAGAMKVIRPAVRTENER